MQLDKMDLGIHDIFTYPPVGEDDYAYMFQTAQVRSMETQMLTRTALLDMANASDFTSAAGSLSGTEYTLPSGAGAAELETMLRQRRSAVRRLFEDLMLDERIVEIFRNRNDYANLRLVLRRVLTDKPVGADYSAEGNAPPELLAQAFEEQNYAILPEHVQAAIDQATLAYYQNKSVRQIDFAIDRAEAAYALEQARTVDGSVFLVNLFRIQVDLTNLRTMLRVKSLGADPRDALLEGGFVEMDEELEDAVARELKEETGLTGIALEQLRAFGTVGRDPRGRQITVVFTGIAAKGQTTVRGGDDAAEARWFPIDRLPENLAFDHDRVTRAAIARLKRTNAYRQSVTERR